MYYIVLHSNLVCCEDRDHFEECRGVKGMDGGGVTQERMGEREKERSRQAACAHALKG